jgi:phospholipid N-methyltransferase
MGEVQHGTGLREHVLLFSRFLRSPRTVGAVTASSRALAAAMVEGLDLGPGRRIVELGPGTGAFTGAIVERLRPGSEFLAVDIDPAFVRQVQRRWPEVQCVCASAERLEGIVADYQLFPIDHIVSGLPFVSLPTAMTRQILQNVAAVLRPGGTFTTFQYVHGYRLPPAVAFRKSLTERLGAPPSTRIVLRNFPPAAVLTWQKPLAEGARRNA